MNPSITQLPARMRDRLREVCDAARGDADGRAVELEISTDPSDAPSDQLMLAPGETVVNVSVEYTDYDGASRVAGAQEIVKRWTGQ
jgi:hypothetical protein